MSTLLACQSDSIVTKVCGNLIPVIQETYEAGTNWANVEIAKTICCSFVLIVAICVLGFLSWKLLDYHAKKNADVRKREWEEKDKNRKQSSDLLDKKLQILCETCYDLSKDEPKKVVKKYNDGAVENYITALNEAIEITPKPQDTQTIATPHSETPENHEN